MISFVVFILILGILILIHEFGHFSAAKKMGVKVEEFGFGFPPRLYSIKKGETVYSLNSLPIGGFVKVFGEEYSELHTAKGAKLLNRAFVYKKPYQKAFIVIAGVLMNFILAIAIYYALLGANGFSSDPLLMLGKYHFKFGNAEEKVLVGAVLPKSPAYLAGLSQGDIIETVNNVPLTNNESAQTIHTPEELISFVNNARSNPIELHTVNVRNGKKNNIVVKPYYNPDPQIKRFVIGISLGEAAIIHYNSFTEKALSGFLHAYNVSAYNISILGQLVGSSVKTKSLSEVSNAVSGPIGIFGEIDDIVKNSGSKLFINLLNVVALLSISLGTINIFPFPALDGGRLVFIVYEWITGKKTNPKIEQYVNLGGMIFLLTLAAVVSFNDILRLIHK